MEPIRQVIHELRDRYGKEDLRIFAERIGGRDIDDESLIRTIWANLIADPFAAVIVDVQERADQRNINPP